MRKEAAKEEWNTLYVLARKYREKKPWRKFYDSDFFCIRFSPEEAGYFTILGMAGECFGLSLYPGEEGFNQLLALECQEMLNLPTEYILREQNCIAMYMEDEESAFRKDQITLQAYEKGYFPYEPDREQIAYFNRYLEQLLDALDYYGQEQCNVNFNEGFIFEYSLEDGSWKGKAVDIKDREYMNPFLMLTDPEQIEELREAAEEKTDCVLEMDFFYADVTLGEAVNGKYRNPLIAVAVDQESGEPVALHVLKPEEDEKVALASMLSQWISENGAPECVLVGNSLTQSAVKSLCDTVGIRLETGALEAVEAFRLSMFEENEEDETDEDSMEELFGGQGLQDVLGAMGMDLDEWKEKASSMTEKEFTDSLSEQLASLMEEAGFFGEDLDMLFDGEEEGYEKEHLKGRRQKEGAVKEFFGQDRDFLEENGRVMLTGSECSRRECLMEGSKALLSQLVSELGIKVRSDNSKAKLTDVILAPDGEALRNYMGGEAAALLDFLRSRTKPEEENFLELEQFPYSMEAVMKLLTLGFIDIGRGWENDNEVLEIYLTAEDSR